MPGDVKGQTVGGGGLFNADQREPGEPGPLMMNVDERR